MKELNPLRVQEGGGRIRAEAETHFRDGSQGRLSGVC